MPKIKLSLNKTSQSKLNRFYKQLVKKNQIFEDTEFQEEFKRVIQYDVRYIQECTEKSIVDAYIHYGGKFFIDSLPTEKEYKDLKEVVRTYLSGKYTNKTFDNNIDIYFNDVKREYIKHPQVESENLEFLPENRDIFIKNNLKLAVSVAKKYQNLGLPFEDLIQIGNCGILKAFDSFDAERSNLRAGIIKDINNFERSVFSKEEAAQIIEKNFKYDSLLNKTEASIPEEGFTSKEDFIDWVKSNIKTAVFASVAFMWIRGYIIQELNKYSTIIRFPKTVKKQLGDGEDDSESDDSDDNDISKTIIRLDSVNPYTEDNYNDKELSEITNEEFAIEDSYISNKERNELFKDVLDNVLVKLPALDRRIIKKKFGVDYPYSMSNQEIAENERISVNEVKYSITKTLQFLSKEITPEMRDTIRELYI